MICADGRPRNRPRARCRRAHRRTAATSESTGCVPGGIRSMPCRSPSGAERLSAWPVWLAPAGRKSRSAIFGIDPPIGGTVSLDGQPLRIETARGRHPARDLPRSRGSPAGRARGGFLDSRERVAPGARQIRAARPRLRGAGAPGRGGGLRSAAGQGAVDRGQGRDLERRQPAEGGARQVARARAEGADRRRTDARHRRRREGGDLPAAARPGARRRVDPDDQQRHGGDPPRSATASPSCTKAASPASSNARTARSSAS